MVEKRATLEMIAPTTDEAIANGLAELGLPRDAVEIEVLDEGTRGLFGLGSRQARVRLTVKEVQPSAPEPERSPIQSAAEESQAEPQDEMQSALIEDLTLHVTRETVAELLDLMGIDANLDILYGEPDDRQKSAPVLVNITGQDLSILIGKRAETLGSLQYITSLIVSKHIGHSVTVVIDVEKYRERRSVQVRQLARRMADQAIKTGRRQVLEPMPAAERRIVHMELREIPEVRTESIGEEPFRKVTIIPVEE